MAKSALINTGMVHADNICTCVFVPYISGNSKAPGVGTLPIFCIEKPFCACTAQRNLRIEWRLQNRILVSVKIKLQAITSGNDNDQALYGYLQYSPLGN